MSNPLHESFHLLVLWHLLSNESQHLQPETSTVEVPLPPFKFP